MQEWQKTLTKEVADKIESKKRAMTDAMENQRQFFKRKWMN